MNMKFYRKLPIPKEVKEQYPLTGEMAATKFRRDTEIKKVFSGESDKFLIIVGPCSADRTDAVTEYLSRLKVLADKVSDKIIIIPRIFTNKPRTDGSGYKGMFHQPNPTDEPDLLTGIIESRKLHLTALNDFGLSSADEMLYPDNHRYFSDLLSFVTVGARSVENQQHRLTASGLDIPVGMKNPTNGNLDIMLSAIKTAQNPHTFLYRGWEVASEGNPFAHAVLRGFYTADGKCVPNYGFDFLKKLCEIYCADQYKNPSVIVDTNHANSGKCFEKQVDIALDVIKSRKQDSEISKLVKGLMIESYLVDGAQNIGSDTFGQSITDPCLGWEKTNDLIINIADIL